MFKSRKDVDQEPQMYLKSKGIVVTTDGSACKLVKDFYDSLIKKGYLKKWKVATLALMSMGYIIVLV